MIKVIFPNAFILHNSIIRILGCYRPTPLQRTSSRFKGIGKEIGEFGLEAVFSFPCNFVFSVVAPLDSQHLDGTASRMARGFI